MKAKYIAKILIAFIVAGILYLFISGRLQRIYSGHLIRAGDRRMENRDYLAALGYYEKILGSDSTNVEAHLRAAIALDSLRRPKEAGWHYGDAKRFGKGN